MKNGLLGILSVVIMGTPVAANSQTITLQYQGNSITGSSDYLPTGFTTPPDGNIVLPTMPYTGVYTASITVTGSIAAQDLYITFYNVSLNDAFGGNGSTATGGGGDISSPIFSEVPQGSTTFCDSPLGSCIYLTASNGTIIGAQIDINSSGYNDSGSEMGAGGADGYFFQYATTEGTCITQAPAEPGGVYTGPTINPCDVTAGNAPAGTWTVTASTPTVTPTITGTLGTNGWYISNNTTLAWIVTGVPAPGTSGCGAVFVPQTTGTTYTCSATNASGSASNSATIKVDSVPPQVTIKSPRKGKAYALNEVVRASYTCLDATSGIASCSGTVRDDAKIPTATPGTFTFTVASTDKAGNQTTKSFLYSVK